MTVMSGPRVVPCVVLFVVSLAAALAAGTETLRFADNFDTFDLRKWKHEITMGGGGNWEFQLYHNSRQNSFVKDGVLHLKPTYTADLIGEDKLRSGFRMDMWGQQPPELCTGNAFWGCERTSTPQNILNPIASARVRTAESFTFKYGRVEVRARLPKGDWLWPAIWLLPADNSYGLWPASGEIDIMESRGNVNGPAGFGVDSSSSTLHWGPDFNTNSFRLTQKVQSLPSGQTFNDGFHTFGLYWDENKLYTYIDDESNVVLSVDFKKQSFWERASESTPGWTKAAKFNPWVGRNNSAPFDSEFYLIMNLAVGGTMGYWSDAPSKPWNDKGGVAPREFWDAKAQWSQTWDPDKSTLAVDSVKVWTFPNSDFHYPRGKMEIPEKTNGGAGSSQR